MGGLVLSINRTNTRFSLFSCVYTCWKGLIFYIVRHYNKSYDIGGIIINYTTLKLFDICGLFLRGSRCYVCFIFTFSKIIWCLFLVLIIYLWSSLLKINGIGSRPNPRMVENLITTPNQSIISEYLSVHSPSHESWIFFLMLSQVNMRDMSPCTSEWET